MPPRLFTAGILLFWLTMTGWLIEREVVPMMIANASPAYQIDLTDEIGSPFVGWNVLSNGKRIGGASSKIVVNEDRSFEFQTKYTFDKFPIKTLDSEFRVSEDGKLLALSAKISAQGMKFEVKGATVNNMIEPRLFRDGVEVTFIDLGKIDLTHQGSVVNTMLLMPRLRGLWVGRTWSVKRFDPLSGMSAQLGKQGAVGPSLVAEVKSEVLHWDRKDVDCYKIEYYEPGKEVIARTWVRKRDGLVLQQEASLGIEMIAQRIPD